MGSLHAPLPPSTPPLPPSSPENSLSRHRIYTSFCLKDPGLNINISNWIECYDPNENSWTHVSPIPGLIENQILKDFAMTSFRESIYIIGGRLCRKHSTNPEAVDSNNFLEVNVEVLPYVLRYDTRINQWFTCAPLNTPRYDFAYSVHDDKIYVAGGISTFASARGVSYAEVYDPSRDQWTPLPNMNLMRHQCAGVSWHGKIHVIGGFAERGDSDSMMTYVERCSAEVYNEQSGRWDLVPGMWQLDVPPNQIVEVSGKLLSSGDCLTDWKGHIETYDGKLNIWYMLDGSQLQIPKSPTSTSNGQAESWPMYERLYLTMAPIGTRLYFLAGYRKVGNSSCISSGVHVFDTLATRDAWMGLEPIVEEAEKELCAHCCVVQIP